MRPFRAALLIGFAVLWTVASSVQAQPQPPRIGYVYPAGGRQGTTFLATIGGQFLGTWKGGYEIDVVKAYCSGSGVLVNLRKDIRPTTGPESEALQKKIEQLRSKNAKDIPTQREMFEAQKKLNRFHSENIRKEAHPALADTFTVEITVSGNAEPGVRELRVETPRGVSNALTFHVGRLPEFREQESEPVFDANYVRRGIIHQPPETETPITLPAVVNGQIVPRDPEYLWGPDRFTPGDVDRFRFAARKGQRLVFVVQARDLIPYLADAVPGWFQATLTLYDGKGKELAYNDDYQFHPDPVLAFTVPEDGTYAFEIRDALSRGRPDFVYRVTVGELPFVTSIFPLGGRAGQQTHVSLRGWNLPVDSLSMDAKGKTPGIYPLSVRRGDMTSNTAPFAVDDLPECFEREPNDTVQTAQPLSMPTIVNGRIDRPGDVDVFRFEGRAGDRIVAEVMARRLESPLDSLLKLTDAAGKLLALNDDHEDREDGLRTHHADSLIQYTLPANGTYCLHLGDAQRQGGPEYAYRLRISPPRPDFVLRVEPSRINARAARYNPVRMFAVRKDGYDGPIELRLKEAPDDFALAGSVIPAGADQAPVTLLVPPMASEGPHALSIEGRATIAGREVIRPAVPADDMMQAFAYKQLLPAQDLKLWIVEMVKPQPPGPQRRAYQPPVNIISPLPLKIPAGGSAELRVAGPSIGGPSKNNKTEVELSNPPAGLTVKSVSHSDKGLAVVVQSEAGKTKPGLKGNLIANAILVWKVTEKDGKTSTNRWLSATFPAIPFEVTSP